MGTDTVTVQNLEILKVDKDSSFIVVKGSIPGHKNSFMVVKESRKRPKGYKKRTAHLAQPKKGAKTTAKAAASKAK